MSGIDRLLRRLSLRPGQPLAIDARHLYILPTRFGWLYGVTTLLMLVAATNYANNPAYLLTFLLGGIGLAALFLTWRNLHGLRIAVLPPEPVFAGQPAQLRLRLDGQARPGVVWQLGEQAVLHDLDERQHVIQLSFVTQRRGWTLPGELVIATRYPLGLFLAWSVIRVQAPVLVYPRPAADPSPGTENEERQATGDDEWQGLREFRSGDSLARVDWKGLARERGLMTKLFSDPERDHPLHIDWAAHALADTETRLSRMTAEVLEAARGVRPWSLRLPGQTLGPAHGVAHRDACLRALALHGLPQEPPA